MKRASAGSPGPMPRRGDLGRGLGLAVNTRSARGCCRYHDTIIITATTIPMVTATTTTTFARPMFHVLAMLQPRCSVLPRWEAMYLQWVWADPASGSSAVCYRQLGIGLIRDVGAVLLDVSVEKPRAVSATGWRQGRPRTDLHLWQVGPGHRAAVISVVVRRPLPPATYKRRLTGLRGAQPCDGSRSSFVRTPRPRRKLQPKRRLDQQQTPDASSNASTSLRNAAR